MLWLKKLPLHSLVLSLCLICGSFLYFWNIANTVQFQGDQGRDALIVANIFKNADPVFIGPVTSVGNMYLGPLYYYFMLPFLFITYPNPLGPVLAIGLLALFGVYLIYIFGVKLFNRNTALIAVIFYTFSSVIVEHARFSWNPNPTAVVFLCLLFFTYKAWQEKSSYWILVSAFFAILIQLHYLTLLTLPAIGLIWLFSLRDTLVDRKKTHFQTFIKHTSISVILFLITLIPLILFDFKHDWLNAKAFTNLFSGDGVFVEKQVETVGAQAFATIKEMHGRALEIMYNMLLPKDTQVHSILICIEIVICYLIYRRSTKKTKAAIIVLITFILITIIGTAFYKSTVFTHYILYILPAVMYFHSFLLAQFIHFPIGKYATFLLLCVYIYINGQDMPLKSTSWTIRDIQNVSASIYSRVVKDEKYNIVLLSDTGDIDGQNYRYFLQASDKQPVKVQDRGEVDTLFIINENRQIPKVTDSPIYEIVVFPNKEIKEVYTINNGPEITVLRR